MRGLIIKTRIIACIFILIFFQVLFAEQLSQNDILNLKVVYRPLISPDGQYIVYYLRIPPENEWHMGTSPVEVHLYNIKTGQDRLFLNKDQRSWNLKWSESGEFLYFLRYDDSSQLPQIYRISPEGGEAEKLTDLKKSVVDFEMFPDGKRILVVLRDKNYVGQEEKYQDWIINETHFKYQHLYLYNLSDDSLLQLTPDSLHVWEFVPSPNRDFVYFQASRQGMVDDNYMFRDLYRVNLQNGKVEKIVNHDGKMGKMEADPGGKFVAFLGATDLYDPTDGSLLLTKSDGNDLSFKNLTDGFEGTVVDFSWLNQKEILFLAEVWNEVKLFKINVNSRKISRVWEGNYVFTSFTADRRKHFLAVSASNYQTPPELFLFNLKKNKLIQLLNHNSQLKDIHFQPQEDFTWKARDGKEIGGILVKPVDFKEGEKYPLIVLVHGGPESAYLKGWNNWYSRWPQILAQKGAFVFMPNYRGSTGRGVEFAEADQGDMMGIDFNDILDGIDALINKGWVDESRVGITGGSYGGYASAWAATRWSEKFAAAVMFVGISNQVSKLGTTDTWYENALVHWRGWAYDDNFNKAWDRSPLKYIKNAKTPILILHGDSDPRVPTSQSHELYRALKYMKVPVELIIYPGEGHGNRKFHHQKHYMQVALEWFDQYIFKK